MNDAGGPTSPGGPQASELSNAAAGVPVVGTFLADCTDTFHAFVNAFLGGTPAANLDTPTLFDVLLSPAAAEIPILGGLVPDGMGGLAPIPAGDAPGIDVLAQGDVPVLGAVPIACDDGLAPLDVPTSLPADNFGLEAIGLIPVLDPSSSPGEIIGVIMAVAGNSPGLPLPEITSAGLPEGTDTLPEPFGSATSSLLSLLGLLGL